MKVWFGGYTKSDSRGIYTISFDQLPLDDVSALTVKIENPTYFQISENNELITIKKDGDLGGIALISLDDLTKTQAEFLISGAPPAYIGINNEEQLVYIANYHLGLLQVFSFADHQFNLIAETKHVGHSVRKEQESAHPHFFDQTPNHNLVGVDLGLDQVEFYDLVNGELKSLAIYQNEPGFGSRHLVFHPTKAIFYVVGELSSQVNVVTFTDNFEFASLQTISTISAEYHEDNGAAAIKISHDGKFLYVSNRGENTIVVYAIDNQGKLHLIQRIKTFGEFPRDFNFSPDESLVIVANQTSNNATVYTRNPETGFLTVQQKNIVTPEATRVLLTENN